MSDTTYSTSRAGTLARMAWASLGEKHAFAWIIALAAVVILAGLGLRDPWPADEPRFAQVAREMVWSGQWLFPTRGGELYSDKPPLFMWLVAALYALTGSLRVAFLLPSALAAIASLVLVHDLARRWWGRRIANHAALLLLATLQFVLQAKSAQIDMTVTFWITLGAYALLRHLVTVPSENDTGSTEKTATVRWYLFGWFAMGLGVITKGVGFLPALLLIPWAVLRVMGRQTDVREPARHGVRRGSVALLAGPLCLLAAVALWLVPMLLAVGASDNPAFRAYRDDILLRQTAERYTNTWTHVSPWYYFFVSVIPLFWLPATVLLPVLMRPWREAFARRDPRLVLPLAWIALVVLFFSLSPGKRGVYVLPCVPMLALAVAPWLEAALARRGVVRAIGVLLAAIAVLFLGIGIAGLLGIDAAREIEANEGLRPWMLGVVLGLVAALAAAMTRCWGAGVAWLAFVVPMWLLYSTWGYTMANEARTPAALWRAAETALAEDGRGEAIEIGLVDFREQYLLFAPYPVTHFGFATRKGDQLAEAWRWVGETPNRRLLLADRFELGCFVPDRATPLGRAHGRQWRLYGSEARATSCPAPPDAVPRFVYRQGGALDIAR